MGLVVDRRMNDTWMVRGGTRKRACAQLVVYPLKSEKSCKISGTRCNLLTYQIKVWLALLFREKKSLSLFFFHRACLEK